MHVSFFAHYPARQTDLNGFAQSKMNVLFCLFNFTLVAASLKDVLVQHYDSVKMVGLGFCDNEGQQNLY